jgi:hypothetical protein
MREKMAAAAPHGTVKLAMDERSGKIFAREMRQAWVGSGSTQIRQGGYGRTDVLSEASPVVEGIR